MKTRTLLIVVIMTGCTAPQVSRARQTADIICAGVAANFHAVKGDTLSESIALACLDRLERNERIEEAIVASMGGTSTIFLTVAGAAGNP